MTANGMAARAGTGEAPPPGLLHPLRHPGFALIAGASLVSNIGVWMRDTTSAWTVAGEAHHHSAVALVQAATALPTFLLALPAGVLADHYDRCRLLILCQLALAAAGATLAALSYAHALSVGAIVVLALFAGSAAALAAPAFQAIVPHLVPQEDIRPAVALSSVSFNIARVVGPGVGALLLASVGPAAAYACNVVAYGVTILALLLVRSASEGPAARTPVAFRAELHQGFVFVGQSAGFRRILLRGSALYLCASCYLALTPLIAHDLMGSQPGVYGVLLAATGCGAIAGGAVLSAAKKRGIMDDALLVACSAAGAVALFVLSQARGPVLASFALAAAGGSTLIQLATFNAAAQLLLPEAIRGRGLAIYMAATFGCMAVGSLLWGAVSDVFSIGAALALGGLGFALAALAGRALPLASAPGAVPSEAAL